MSYKRGFVLFIGVVVCSLAVLPAHASIIPAFDATRVLAFDRVGGSDPRVAESVTDHYYSPDVYPTGFIAGDGRVDQLTFTLKKFDKAKVAADMGVDISKIRLEQVIIDMSAQTRSGYNVIDSESPRSGTVTNLTIGAQVSVWSTNVTQQVTLGATAAKNLAASGPLIIGADDPTEDGVPIPLFGGKILNADYTGSDSLRVEITGMIKAASEVTLNADGSREDGDDVLSDFIGTGTIGWKATGTKVASDQSNITRQTANESPTFDVETRVVYIYSVAPEPTSLGLLALGLLPLVAKWRKRRLARS